MKVVLLCPMMVVAVWLSAPLPVLVPPAVKELGLTVVVGLLVLAAELFVVADLDVVVVFSAIVALIQNLLTSSKVGFEDPPMMLLYRSVMMFTMVSSLL